MKLYPLSGSSAARLAMVLAAIADSSMAASAQGQRPCLTVDPKDYPTKILVLHNASQPNDGNELLTGLRLMLDPSTKLYLVPSQQVIVVHGCPDEVAAGEKLLSQLDKPRKKFRLTYTLTETDAGKRIGVQHVSLFAEEGQRTTLKTGSKVPVATGSVSKDSQVQTQMTYLDIGLTFDATAVASGGDEVTLKSRVEQSSVAEEKSGVGPQDPVVRQSTLEGVSLLTPGKPQVLGAVDITGTTRHLEIEVVADLVK